RLAVRLYGHRPADPRAARPRPRVHGLRVPERLPRPPERVESARPRLPLATRVRGRRAVGDPVSPCRAAHLVAAPARILLAAAREVRHPRLPPARLLLRLRLSRHPRGARARDRRARRSHRRPPGQCRHRGPGRSATDLRIAVHTVRDVVRHGVEQGPQVGPAVSVITPTLNRLSFLRRALESLASQTYGDFEAVVVVDGPSPDLAEFVAGHPDPRVRLVQRETTGGTAAARNSGLEVARGHYVGFLDDDDLWLPTKLERQVPLLDAGADVVHSLVYVADADGKIYDKSSERGFRLFREVAAAGYPYVWLLRRSSYQISSFLVRRECVDAVGGFDPMLSGIDDIAFV